LLRRAEIEFDALPTHVDERPPFEGECDTDYALALSLYKAETVTASRPETPVLGADTVVVVDNHILEKPLDHADASRMLNLLSGREHDVITGICLLGNGGRIVDSARTRVHFATLSKREIDDYVNSGEPMDKAGAYAIQGAASRWIYKIVGCYFNVVGLPVALVYRMLQEHGVAEALQPG